MLGGWGGRSQQMFPRFEITKPLLLLDVDGVLIPYAASAQPAHFHPYTLLDELVWLAPHHGDWLQPLSALFHIVWATGWEHDANRFIAPILNLPAFPVIEFTRDAAGLFEKLPILARIVPHQPMVWIDDQLTPEAHAWPPIEGYRPCCWTRIPRSG
jgi:hypothetical protein